MSNRHPLLDQLARDRAGLRSKFSVTVRSTTYEFAVLDPEGDEWVAVTAPGDSLVAWATERKKYQFAAALLAIDGVPVETLFPLTSEEMAGSPRMQRGARRRAVLDFVREALDAGDFRAFETSYAEEEKKRSEAFKTATPGKEGSSFSTGTPSPASAPTF